jgi:putative NADH-flavin reductase
VRHPETFQVWHPALRIVRGDILSLETVEPAVAGQDVILAGVALKPTPGKTTNLYSEGIANLITAMEKQNVRRLFWVSTAAIDLENQDYLGFAFKHLVEPILLKHIYADVKLSEEALRKTSLDWILIHPTQLTDGPRTGVYQVSEHLLPRAHRGRISRADVADFMLKQLTDNIYLHKTPTLTY